MDIKIKLPKSEVVIDATLSIKEIAEMMPAIATAIDTMMQEKEEKKEEE